MKGRIDEWWELREEVTVEEQEVAKISEDEDVEEHEEWEDGKS